MLSDNPGCPGGCAYIKDGDSSSEVWCMGEGPYTPDYTCPSATETPGNELKNLTCGGWLLLVNMHTVFLLHRLNKFNLFIGKGDNRVKAKNFKKHNFLGHYFGIGTT